MLHSSAKGLPVSLAAIGVFPTARPRSFGPQGLRRFDAPPGVLSLLLYFLFLPLSLFDAPLEAHCPVFFTDGCIARAWRAVTNPFRFFFAVLFCVCLCVPASSQGMPAPLASLFLLLMIPSPCLSSYFIKKEHGGFKRGDTGSEESEDGAGTCTTAWTRAQMDLVNRYVIVRAQDVSQRPSAHRGQRVRCPPAAGLHAGSSTVSGGDAGLQ